MQAGCPDADKGISFNESVLNKYMETVREECKSKVWAVKEIHASEVLAAKEIHVSEIVTTERKNKSTEALVDKQIALAQIQLQIAQSSGFHSTARTASAGLQQLSKSPCK